MPLYDCMLLLKPHIRNESVMELVTRVGKHVYRRNGVLTELKSLGTVQLGYGIKKLDGRYYQGKLMQMTMMTPPSFNKELHYLNKEDRLLRWILVKHRDFKSGGELVNGDDGDFKMLRGSLFNDDSEEDEESDEEGKDSGGCGLQWCWGGGSDGDIDRSDNVGDDYSRDGISGVDGGFSNGDVNGGVGDRAVAVVGGGYSHIHNDHV